MANSCKPPVALWGAFLTTLFISAPALGALEVVQLEASNVGKFVNLQSELGPEVALARGVMAFEARGGVAQMIVNQQVVVTASEGARVNLAEKQGGGLQLKLINGAVHVLAASNITIVSVPAHDVSARNTELFMLRTKDNWEATVIGSHNDTDSFAMTIIEKNPEKDLETTGILKMGSGTYRLASSGKVTNFPNPQPLPGWLAVYRQLSLRKAPAPKLLSLAKVDDIKAARQEHVDTFEDQLELEDIEIEAGCVEICID